MGAIVELRPRTDRTSWPAWQWLETWMPWHPIPAGVNREALPLIAEEMDDLLRPADFREFAVAIDGLFGFFRVFGAGDYDVKAATAQYRDTLSDIPFWALQEALDTIRATWKWPSLPKPADLRAALPGRYHGLRSMRVALRSAMAAPGPVPTISPPNRQELLTAADLRQLIGPLSAAKPAERPSAPIGDAYGVDRAWRDQERSGEAKRNMARRLCSAGFAHHEAWAMLMELGREDLARLVAAELTGALTDAALLEAVKAAGGAVSGKGRADASG